MGLEISKLMTAKRHVNIDYPGEIQAIPFLAIGQVYENVALLKFNMGVNGKIVKCAVSSKQVTVERNGWNSVTCRPIYCICRILFVSGSSSSVCGHSVQFAKFPMFRFQKGYCSHSFLPISIKRYGKHDNQRGKEANYFFGSLPNFKNFMVY